MFFNRQRFYRIVPLSSKWILSATEIETFELCRRKWAYHYLDAVKPPPSKAAQFGLSVHRYLERYLTGDSPDHQSPEGRVASAGLQHLPPKLPRENVERPIFFHNRGHIFHGYIDFFEQLGSQTWLIGDHKTSSILSRALSADELKKNTQANVYAQWAFAEKNAELIQLRWIYYRTSSTPKSIVVDAELTKAEANDNFARIAYIADDIVSIARERPPSASLPKNLSACFKYGRCPFYAQCKSSSFSNNDILDAKESHLSSRQDDSKKSFHLYVDCVPTKNDVPYKRTVELAELLQPVLKKIQTEKELSHYRLAGYGQHVGLIANYLREHLIKEAFDDDTAILSSAKTPEGCDTLQTLTSHAGLVVRGF